MNGFSGNLSWISNQVNLKNYKTKQLNFSINLNKREFKDLDRFFDVLMKKKFLMIFVVIIFIICSVFDRFFIGVV